MDLQTKLTLIAAAYKFAEDPADFITPRFKVRALLETKGFFGATDDILRYASACKFSVVEEYSLRYKNDVNYEDAKALDALAW